MKLDDALADYAESLLVRSKRTTAKTAGTHMRAIRKWFSTFAQVSDITPARVDGFVQHLRDDAGLSDATINGALRVLRAAMRLAEENGRLGGYKAPKVKLLKEVRKIPKVLTGEEVQRLIAAAPDDDTRLAIMFAADAGLRHQEIAHLRWMDVNLVQVSVCAKEGWSPKTHAERLVPLTERLRLQLGVLRNGGPYGKRPGDWIFGKPRDFSDTVKAAFMRAGLWDKANKPGLHMLRRTFASRLLQKGVDIETVRELGGWADLATVQRYVASTDDVKRNAVALLEEE